MKRVYLLIFIIMMLLAACGGEEASSPTTAPTQEPAITNTAAPTATTFVRPTLPPEATISVNQVTARPTRTPAPTITPAATGTSMFNPEVTPVEALETQQASRSTLDALSGTSANDGGVISEPAFIVTYDDLTTILRGYDPPQTADTLVAGSQRVSYHNEKQIVIFMFDVQTSSGTINITAELDFKFLDEQVFATFSSVYNTNNPSQIYAGDLVTALAQDFQKAVLQAFSMYILSTLGEMRSFAITEFSVSSLGLDVKALVQT